jgi:oxalate decarboxylase
VKALRRVSQSKGREIVVAERKRTFSIKRRSLLGAAAAALSTGAMGSRAALAQTRTETLKGEQNHSASNPGPINRAIAGMTPNSDMPPVTDRGVIMPIWYSFDLTHRRIQDGGWTRQVTARELPPSQDLAGVTMRLTAGSYRELHWHTANEWAYMLYGNARVTVFNPEDGTIFIGDVGEGDLWLFPTGFPHSIQGLGPDGCEFLLVFDQGMFSEYTTSLLSGWLAHTPSPVISRNFRIPEAELKGLPKEGLYIFPGTVPGPLEEDRRAVGGSAVASKIDYTFRMKAMTPKVETPGGTIRVVDSKIFPAANTMAAALFHMKPGALRELHWHPNASEWQYYIAGSGRMTVFASEGQARTMDYRPNDVGYVPQVAGHYVENTGNDDLAFLALFKSSYFSEVSLNQWMRRLPMQMIREHLGLGPAAVSKIPNRGDNIIGR